MNKEPASRAPAGRAGALFQIASATRTGLPYLASHGQVPVDLRASVRNNSAGRNGPAPNPIRGRVPWPEGIGFRIPATPGAVQADTHHRQQGRHAAAPIYRPPVGIRLTVRRRQQGLRRPAGRHGHRDGEAMMCLILCQWGHLPIDGKEPGCGSGRWPTATKAGALF